MSNLMQRLIAVVLLIPLSAIRVHAAESEWGHPGPDGKLVYKTTPVGDRILDFSYAGYMGGGVALPDVPVRVTVKPSGGADDTDAIQKAIDQVAKMPMENGFRGAVLLAPGNFTCSKSITISTSGIVLRGSGSGEGGTTIHMVGAKHRAILIGRGRESGGDRAANDETSDSTTEPTTPRETSREHTTITDSYVPAGATSFTVENSHGFAVGQTITIRRPTTAAWVHFMNMDTLKRDGRAQTWIGLNRSATSERKISAIDGNKITVDIPLADSYDTKYLGDKGVSVTTARPSSNIDCVGVEKLHIQCPPLEIDYGNAPYAAIRIGADDCWVRDVYCEETMNSTVLAGKRITMQNIVVTHTYPNLGASKPTDFSIEGSQILIDRCRVTGDNEYFVWTGSLQAGPSVVLNSVFRGRGSRIQPHQRWSTGLLVDNCVVPDGGIDFANRGVAGSGHGWTMGWGVAWNCIASTFVIQQPPGAFNWAIGCIGKRVQTARYFDTAPILPEGIFESHGTPVAPQSLYLAQLQDRLGPQALKNIGYSSNIATEFPDKETPQLSPRRASVDKELGPDLALWRPINTSGVRDNKREFGAEKAIDGDDNTYWAANDNARRMTLEIDMEGPVEISALEIGEAMNLGERVQEYRVDAQVDSDWKPLSRGTAIGARRIDKFEKVTAWKVRLTILKCESYPAIRKFALYCD